MPQQQNAVFSFLYTRLTEYRKQQDEAYEKLQDLRTYNSADVDIEKVQVQFRDLSLRIETLSQVISDLQEQRLI